MYTTFLFSALSGLALVRAQSEAFSNPTIPAVPTTTAGIPTIEGALVYDGPPVPGFVGPGGDAVVQSDVPAATYVATLPTAEFDPNTGTVITGTITGSSVAGGSGVTFSVNFAGFPSEVLGPFVYHIHELPVPSDGNCTGTMAHLDPTQRGELHACDASAPQTCQAGDLAGKHGNITTPTFSTVYSDLYLSTIPGSPYFFGDVSVVIHSSNATRLTCANFTMVTSNLTSSSSPNSTVSPTPTAPTTPEFTGAANRVLGSVSVFGGFLAALAAFAL